MNILLTNDDGINSKGLINLKKELSKKHKVITVAPKEQRSGYSHHVSIFDKVRITQIDDDTYICDGTPADCVKFTIEGFLTEKIDFIASGINEGPNLGTDVFYSGTVAAAREGLINGIPSCAFSINSYFPDKKFEAASFFSSYIVDLLYAKFFKNNEMYNVNLPNSDYVEGLKFTKTGKRIYREKAVKKIEDDGSEYFYIEGEIPTYESIPGTDFWAVENNFISITPMNLDATFLYQYDRLSDEYDNFQIPLTFDLINT